MAPATLPRRPPGSLRPSMQILWSREAGEGPEDLTGATLTGTITDKHGAARPIAGDLSVDDPGTAGLFTWEFAPADVETEGAYTVEITASFADGPSPAVSFAAAWEIARHNK